MLIEWMPLSDCVINSLWWLCRVLGILIDRRGMNQFWRSVNSNCVGLRLSLGRERCMSTAAAKSGIGTMKNGKNTKASSELCKFLGVPHQSRSETALLLSKFIKLNNSRVGWFFLPSIFTILRFLPSLSSSTRMGKGWLGSITKSIAMLSKVESAFLCKETA